MYKIIIFLSSLLPFAATAQIQNLSLSSNSVGKYKKIEVIFDVNNSLNNTHNFPYDESEVLIRADFISPSGKQKVVHAFYNEGYNIVPYNCENLSCVNANTTVAYECDSLIPTNINKWNIRFTPDEVGQWEFSIHLFEGSNISVYPSNGSKVNFQCVASNEKGFIRTANQNYLKFEEEVPFYPIGQNVGWYTGPAGCIYDEGIYGLNEIKDYMDKISANGGNTVRMWLDANWAMCLSCHDSNYGTNYYDQLNARKASLFDGILNYAESKGIFLQICLFNGSSTIPSYNESCEITDGHWKYFHPYNFYNGGPLVSPFEYFTNSKARSKVQNLLRYIGSRWGYSTHVLGWEIWNEMELLNCKYFSQSYFQDQIDWHDWVANNLNYYDPNQHIITSSVAAYRDTDANGNVIVPPLIRINDSPNMDMVQTHRYSAIRTEGNFEELMFGEINTHKDTFPKPFMIGESGFSWEKPDSMELYDPQGVVMHSTLWSSFFSGAAGPHLFWYWDAVDRLNYYTHYQPISNFLTTLPLLSGKFEGNIQKENGLRMFFLTNDTYPAFNNVDTILGWVQDTNFAHWNLLLDTTNALNNQYLYTLDDQYKPSASSNNNQFQFNVKSGLYKVEWYSTITGQLTKSTYEQSNSNNFLTISIPNNLRRSTFGDAAFMISYCCNNNLSKDITISRNMPHTNLLGNTVGSHNNPLTRTAYKSISSSKKVDPNGKLYTEAGESIHLKTGFKVDKGAYFRAKILKSCTDLCN